MSVIDPTPTPASPLVARVKAILMTPSAEWDRIDGEPATVGGLYTGYVAILAAIPVVAQFIGSLVFGYSAIFVSWRPSLIGAVVTAIMTYALSLVSVFIMTLVIDALAPSFNGQKNQIQALKVAAYASTASWVAGIAHIFPPIGALAILGGLYSLYLLYLGIPKLMKAPQANALAYTAVSIIVAVILTVVVGAVTGGLTRFAGGGIADNPGHISGTVNLPGGSVDLGKLDAAAKSAENAANQLAAQQAGSAAPATAVKAVAPDVLQGLLPADLSGGFARSEVSSNSAGAAGMNGSSAEGVYNHGTDGRITLQVTDLGAAGALAALGGALNVNSSKQTATGYEKVTTANGQMINESYDTPSKSGKYSVTIANRFVVEAEGTGVDMNDMKSAVGAVNSATLQSLAKG